MKKIILVSFIFIFITSCSSTRLKPEAAHVIVSHEAPNKNCKLLGTTEASSHVNIANVRNNVLINIIKNNAHEMGGNYVQLNSSTTLKYVGQVFQCNN